MMKGSTGSQNSLLVIEREVEIYHIASDAVSPLSYSLKHCRSIKQARQWLQQYLPELVVLNWQMAEQSSTPFLKWLRGHPDLQHIPVITVLSEHSNEQTIAALESGADDCISIPFTARALRAHIQAILRRGPILRQDAWLFRGKLSINTQNHQVTYDQRPLSLTPTEYKLLRHLVMHEGNIQSRQQLMSHVWGNNHFVDERTVDVQVKRLRAKFKPLGARAMIKTARGFGYMFVSMHSSATLAITEQMELP